jgi:2-oxoglutarate ferredoxin oxidoreductase subunit beta
MMQELEKYLRRDRFPHMWCPGCGNGIVLGCLLRAIKKLGLEQDKTIIVGGIGCSSRAVGYLDFNTLHTTHGRALAFATGIKLARPELNVIVVTGDGDATAIGGNHFIHAARRNIDLTVVLFNNNIYGMTGGQYSPLTPANKKATTAPHGTIEPVFDVAELARAAGATFVGRSTTYHTNLLTSLIAGGIENKGFSLVEAITACPTNFGRRNKMKGGAEMLLWQRDNAVHVQKTKQMSPGELEGKIVIGLLHKKEAPEYTFVYDQIIARAREESGPGTLTPLKGGESRGRTE